MVRNHKYNSTENIRLPTKDFRCGDHYLRNKVGTIFEKNHSTCELHEHQCCSKSRKFTFRAHQESLVSVLCRHCFERNPTTRNHLLLDQGCGEAIRERCFLSRSIDCGVEHLKWLLRDVRSAQEHHLTERRAIFLVE